jgi:hypothetical protein
MTDDVNPIDLEKADEAARKNLAHYRNLMQFMGANVPIQALCLPTKLENALISAGFDRAYDLIGSDLTKIKGIGRGSVDLLTSRLDEFFTICL